MAGDEFRDLGLIVGLTFVDKGDRERMGCPRHKCFHFRCDQRGVYPATQIEPTGTSALRRRRIASVRTRSVTSLLVGASGRVVSGSARKIRVPMEEMRGVSLRTSKTIAVAGDTCSIPRNNVAPSKCGALRSISR